MGKGNPIVGLAHVVASQQEMLEEANVKNRDLTEQYKMLLYEKENLEKTVFHSERGDIPMSEVETVFYIYEQRIKELVEQCNDIKREADKNTAELGETKEHLKHLKKQMKDFDTICVENAELLAHLQSERERAFHWVKWTPESVYPLDKFGNIPVVEGLYLYSEKSRRELYDSIRGEYVSVAGKYSVDCVLAHSQLGINGRPEFSVSPINVNGEEDYTLVAVGIHDTSRFMLMDEMPEIIEYGD